jgi:hypothetical protein
VGLDQALAAPKVKSEDFKGSVGIVLSLAI